MLAVALLNSEARPNDLNMPTQHIATLLGATCCLRLLLLLLGVVGASLKMVKLEPTTLNTSQQSGQNARNMLRPTMLRWHVANVWPGLNERVDDHLTMKLNVLTIQFRLVG